jgi:signal transduction histidine kinase
MRATSRYVLLPAFVVAVCFFIRESFTISAMGVQQQFPFGVATVLVGFFLGFRAGLMMLLMTGLSVYLWGTHPNAQYPLALPINLVLALPALAVSAYIRRLLNEQRSQREMLGDFIAILAHEVRTPLSTIKMAAENLQESHSDAFAMRRAGNLLLASERIEDVISRCVDTDLMELNEICPKLKALDLMPFLRDRIDLSVDPDRIIFDCQFSKFIITDPFLYGAVISNLLENALKYSLNHSHVTLLVFEQSKRGRRGVMVRCENFIAPRTAPDPKKLFRKYYRSDSVAFLPGMGLGLWYSNQIVNALSGSIGAEIKPSKVAFSVWVPCEP